MSWLSKYVDHPYLLILAISISLPIIWQHFKWIFGDLNGFVSDLSLGGSPDWYTLFKNKYFEGEWAEIKLVFFLFISVALTASLYKVATLIFY